MNVKRDGFWYNQYIAQFGKEMEETSCRFVGKCATALIMGFFAHLALVIGNIISVFFFGYFIKVSFKEDEIWCRPVPYWPKVWGLRITPAGAVSIFVLYFFFYPIFAYPHWIGKFNEFMDSFLPWSLIALFSCFGILVINTAIIGYHLWKEYGERIKKTRRKLKEFFCRPVKFVN